RQGAGNPRTRSGPCASGERSCPRRSGGNPANQTASGAAGATGGGPPGVPRPRIGGATRARPPRPRPGYVGGNPSARPALAASPRLGPWASLLASSRSPDLRPAASLAVAVPSGALGSSIQSNRDLPFSQGRWSSDGGVTGARQAWT